ncbi:hypothetical protein NIBR502774_19110 (plasmid) [Rhizobium sp. NIBRBAC000502774]|nr:hypothetical protein NIBR502774_19110 [Rhizobium sp. NIBRBAC000502774]
MRVPGRGLTTMLKDQVVSMVDAAARAGLSRLELSQQEFSIKLSRGSPSGSQPPLETRSPVTQIVQSEARISMAELKASVEKVHAPMSGVVHFTPSPGEPFFVEPGGKVEPGSTLCTIEAMKLFTPVQSVKSGVVDKILVKSGQEITAGDVLMLIMTGEPPDV